MTPYLRSFFLYLAYLIAVIGLVLSLFYGEVLGNSPCSLCWYQRIFLFPLAIILGIASYRNDFSIIPYAQTLVVLGAGIGFFQIAQRYLPFLKLSGICSFGTHCANSWIKIFGILDFPWMSSLGFVFIFACLFLANRPVRFKDDATDLPP